jgi:glutamate dehydrogenase
MQRFVEAGAPEAAAAAVAALRSMTSAINVADLARSARLEPVSAGRLYHAVGGALGFDRLRAAAVAVRPSDPYERQALRGLIVELISEQLVLAKAIAGPPGKARMKRLPDADAVLENWIDPRRAVLERARRVVADIEASGGSWTFAKLTIANAALKEVGAR